MKKLMPDVRKNLHRTINYLLKAIILVFAVGLCFPGVSKLGAAEEIVVSDSEQKAVSAETATPGVTRFSVTAIGVVKDAKGTSVTISGDATLPFEYSVIAGKNLVVDIPGATSKVWPDAQQVDDFFISRIRISEILQPKKMVRVVFDLMSDGPFAVKGDGSNILVQFGSPANKSSSGGALTAGPGSDSRQSGQAGGLNRVSALEYVPKDHSFRIIIKTDAPPEYIAEDTGDPRRISVLITSATLERSLQQGTDLSGVNAIVKMVKIFQEKSQPPAVRVLAELLQPAPYHVSTTAAGVTIDVSVPQLPANAQPLDSSDEVAGGTRTAASSRGGALAPSAVTSSEKISGLSSSTSSYAANPSRSEKLYSGNKISLDFVDSDLQDIFRLISDVSGFSIVFGEELKGKRTVQLQNTPWDQALDMILKTNSPPLDKIQESNNIIRIVTVKSIMDEKLEAEKKRMDVQKLADLAAQNANDAKVKEYDAKIKELQNMRLMERERKRLDIISKGLIDKTFLVSYADIESIASSITAMTKTYEDLFSPKAEERAVLKQTDTTALIGNRATTNRSLTIPQGFSMDYGSCPGCLTQVDKRTSTIFVRTYPYYLEQYELIIAALDKPTPAIMIEARIVEVESNYEESLGIQWGVTAVKDAAHGNATPFAFPNSVNIAGTQSDGTGTYMVNLPAANPVAGVGISFGHIANTLSLNIALSALEKLGKTKILSNPKLLAVQGEKSKIQIGQQLPFTTTTVQSSVPVDAQGNVIPNANLNSTEWKNVGIIVEVTPRITYDNRVFMTLYIEKSSRAQDVVTSEGINYSVNMSNAEVKVLIEDGSTAVVGGLFTETTSDGTDGVPGLADIPFLGWLFKAKRNNSSRKEMMIFVTPRIIPQ